MLGTVFAILIVFLLVEWFRWRKRRFSIFNDLGIPGPKPNLFSGNYREILQKGVGNCQKEWIKQYGKVLGYFRGGVPILLIADNDLAKQILIKDFDKFTDRPSVFTLTQVMKDGEVYSSRLVALKGKKRWKEIRDILTPAFTSCKMKSMIPQISDATETFIEIIGKRSTSYKTFNIFEMYGRLTLDIICRILMSTKIDSQHNPDSKIHKAGSYSNDALALPRFLTLSNIYFPEFQKLYEGVSKHVLAFKKRTVPVAILGKFVKECMQFRRTSEKYRPKDVLQKMMDSHTSRSDLISSANTHQQTKCLETEDMKTKNTETNSMFHNSTQSEKKILPMTDNEIVDNAVMFQYSGFQPMRNTLSFATHLLIQQPEIQKKIREEIWENIHNENNFDYNSLLKLKYLECFLTEALRMFPHLNSFVSRVANEDVECGPYTIKKGMIVQIAVQYINSNPDIWQHPEKCDPDRFCTGNINAKDMLSFGAGPKRCPGERLAMLQMKLILARILYQYELIPVGDTKDEITVAYDSISMTPKDGVHLKAVPVKKTQENFEHFV